MGEMDRMVIPNFKDAGLQCENMHILETGFEKGVVSQFLLWDLVD